MNTTNLFSKLPSIFNNILFHLNFFNSELYGIKYHKYKSIRISKNYHYFDNTPELIKIINYAVNNVEYYRNRYKPVKSIQEFTENWGFIDKDIVMNHWDQFISKDINLKKYVKGTTGGTSGKPLQLIIPKNRYVFELATMHTLWQTTGWNYHARGVIRNHRLPKNKTYIINPITKEYIFDGFRTDDEYYLAIYNTLKDKKIQYVHAYPSSAYQFCVFIKNNKLDPGIIKAFLSGSESVFDFQVELIEKQLGIRFYNWYGHSEKLVLGGYCQHSRHFHIEPTYGFFELIDENGNSVTTPGKVGEIVGTTLHNFGMPLIRYRTGDYAEYVGNFCPLCNRQLPIIKNIKGRWSGEKIFNKDGTFVTTTALNLHSNLYSVINGIQYVQSEKGKLEVLIIKSSEYTDNHEKELLHHFKSKLNDDSEVVIRYVDHLIKQPNGKFLLLISNVK